MGFRSLLVFAVFFLSAGASSSQFRDSLDLRQFIRDEAALSKLLIQYDRHSSTFLFVYGDGRVVRQSNSQVSGDLIPTCTGKVPPGRIQQLLQGFLDHHLFDLPQKSYLLLLASDDPGEEMQLHSIIFDDEKTRAQRTFAYGTYAGKKEPVPADFSESEKLLQELEQEAITPKPCGIAPRIRLPQVDPTAPKMKLQRRSPGPAPEMLETPARCA